MGRDLNGLEESVRVSWKGLQKLLVRTCKTSKELLLTVDKGLAVWSLVVKQKIKKYLMNLRTQLGEIPGRKCKVSTGFF